jgi:plastocyanin
MKFRRRSAVGAAMIGGIVIVVLIVAAAGLYLTLGRPSPSGTLSQTTPTTSHSSSQTPSTTTQSATQSITSSSSETSSKTTTSTTTTTATQSNSSTGQAFPVALSTSPDTILMAPGDNQSYVSLTVAPCQPLLSQTPCNLPESGSEAITLNASSTNGIQILLARSTVTVSVGSKTADQVTVVVPSSAAPGDYSVSIQAQSGTTSSSYKFTVRVVQYLIYMTANSFNPLALNVKVGATVYWMNLDAPAGGDPEVHNVIFTTGTGAQSSSLQQYGSYSYTFTAAGSYSYYCSFHAPDMKGTVIVTSG